MLERFEKGSSANTCSGKVWIKSKDRNWSTASLIRLAGVNKFRLKLRRRAVCVGVDFDRFK